MRPLKIIFLCVGIVAALLFSETQPGWGMQNQTPVGGGLSTLQRAVASFDFEESEEIPMDLPLNFHRYLAVDQGFPPFGRMQPSREAAASGSWSFLFELGGGSLSARIPPGVIPVLPNTDYLVEVKVRTANVTHAKARLLAWQIDAQGDPIPQSQRQSEAVQTDGTWQTLTVTINGTSNRAADLIVELQLAQPRQLGKTGANEHIPLFEDVTGQAWFDDLKVWHLPQAELSSVAQGNVFIAPDMPQFHLRVRDVVNEPLTAQLRIYDIDGNLTQDLSIPAPRGPIPQPITVPVTEFGWYRAVLDVKHRNSTIGRQSLDFLLLPPLRASGSSAKSRFGIVLDTTPDLLLADLPELVRKLDASTILLPVWEAGGVDQSTPQRRHAFAHAIRPMIADDRKVIFSLAALPDPLATELGIHPEQVLDVFNKNPDQWQPYLADLLLEYGLEVQRWQIGSTTSPDALEHRDFPQIVDKAHTSFSEFAPDPLIYVPQAAQQTLPDNISLPARHISLPYHVYPDAIGEYVRPWLDNSGELLLTLQALPQGQYAPRQRALDLLLRGLHAWRNGVKNPAIEAPWTVKQNFQPDPTFGIWRTLIDQLSNRRFVGELQLADNVECWIAEGDSPDDGLLIIWNQQHSNQSEPRIRIMLGQQQVTATDAFGNPQPVEFHEGAHEIVIRGMPIFVHGISLPLAQFRAAFRLNEPFVNALHKVHQRELILENPWDVPISGTIHLRSEESFQISPRQVAFSLRPDEVTHIPLDIIPDRSIIAGTKRIEASIEFTADTAYELDAHTNVQVGLENVELLHAWRTVEDPATGQAHLVVTQFVTNTGSHPLNLRMFLLAPAVSQKRRDIPTLHPGQTVVRAFRIDDGLSLLSGKSLHIGVSERDGIARLNHVLTLPEFEIPRQATAETDQTQTQ